MDLEATDHGSNASEIDADEAAAKQAVKTAEKRLESATTLPQAKIKTMLADSNWQPATPGLAMAAMMRSPDEHPTQSEIGCDENHEGQHFLVAGCDDYPATLEKIFGGNAFEFAS